MKGAGAKHRIFRGLSKLIGGRASPEPGQRVLLYHSIGTSLPDDPYGIAMDRTLFRAHLERLDSLRPILEPAPFGLPSGAKPEVSLTFDDGFRDTLTVAAPLLAERSLPFTLFATSGFIKEGSALYLSPAELKELARLPGVRIGSHGATHRRLTGLSDAELREELTGSRKFLEDLIGRPVASLSYPHGDVDRRVRDAAREAGYALGGCSRYGANAPGRDPLLLCRTELTAWDTAGDLELKARGAWDWFRFRRPDPAA